MKKITQFAVNYPVTILMMVLAVLLLGYISFSKLGIDLFPELNNPRLFIGIEDGNRPPGEMENLYVKNIEAQAIRQSDVVNVTSVSKVGTASITVEYAWGKDMDAAFLDLQKAMTSYAQNSGIDAVNITQYDPNSTPVMQVALSNENLKNLDELRKVAENYIRNELIRLEGIADVTLAGEEIAEVQIETDPYLLEAYGITVSELSSKIQAYNRNVSGGTIEENGVNYSVKGVGMLNNPTDFASLIVGLKNETQPDGSSRAVPVYLHDVARVSVTNKDPETIVMLNGERCIGLSVYKEPHYNTVKAIGQLNEAFENITRALPGYSFTVIKNQGTFINQAIGEVKDSALMGIFLAVVILFVFLRRINTTLVVAISIPISIVATFTLMYFKGLTLNVMTLGGLALGAGMLVDNAIIVMENIYRNLEKGKSLVQSAIEGTAEVGGAITASTLTTIVVFLPIVYLQGASGELFKDQAWTVAFSLLSSLLVAILVIPVLVAKFMKGNKDAAPVKTIQMAWYGGLLKKILHRRWLVIFLSIVAMGGTALLVPKIGSEFMPSSSSDSFSLEVYLPEGTRLENTTSALEKLEAMVRESAGKDVSMVYTQVGELQSTASGASSSRENIGMMHILLSESGKLHYNQVAQTLNAIMETNPEVAFSFHQEETSLKSILGNDEPPLVVEIVGEDLETIGALTEQMKNTAAEMPGLYNVESSVENGAPEIDVRIDRIQAGYYNLSIEQIIEQVKSRLEGTDAGEYETNGEMRSITIKQPRISVAELANLEITNGTSRYRLSDVATLAEARMPREIHRSNQSRAGKVSAYINPDLKYDQVVRELESRLSAHDLPNGYRLRMAGEEMKRKESMGGLTFALLLSIVLVYMVMAAQFESLLHPFTILLTIPLALVGTVLTFFLMGIPFNMMAFIGMIMLAGIAVNDSIILVDKINQLRNEGMPKRAAIVEAGRQRIRPIVMTSLTTILALLPLTIGFGESASLRAPMALAVVGGLVTATILSLVVIPCVYDVIDLRKDKQPATGKQ